MIEGRSNPDRQTLARRQLYAACFLALTTWGGTGVVHAQASEAPREYALEAGTLEAALNQLSRQSQVQIVFRPDMVAGKRSGTVSGQLTWRQALDRLLMGSGLEYRQVADKTIVIQAIAARPATEPRSPEAPKPVPPARAARIDSPVKDVQGLIVTGTRIRGGTTPSPVIKISSEQMQQEGFSDLGAVVRSVPQNFAGGQNPGVTSGAGLGGVANQNITGGSALNLRGLGPDATLTLLNGRRLVYSGYVQAIDIGAIPVEAVDRVEIVPDGSSAIYGSDAVGGVANVVLKRQYDGVSIGARYGTATQGGLTSREYTATAGANWSSGGLVATWRESSADSIMADQRSYTDQMSDPNTIYPDIDTSSGLLSLNQALGDVAELRIDALSTRREQDKYFGYPSFYYYYPYDASIWLVSPSVEFFLPGAWSLTVGGTYGKDKTEFNSYYVDDGVSDADGASCYCNDSHSYEIGAEGPLFALSAGDARLAVGIGVRSDEFSSESATTRIAGNEGARYAYAEFSMPLVGPASSIVGIRRFDFSAAVRTEDYDSFGRVTTPKIGVIYDPNADVTFKASWGRSFKAPTLVQRFETKSAYLWTAAQVGGSGYPSDATVLMSYGGNADLDAERARTWSASVAFHPEALPGFESELTWFDIDYIDRVVQPLNYIQALSNPLYAQSPFVDFDPTGDKQAALLAVYSDLFINYAGAAYDPSKVVAILSDQYVNAARQRIRGIDLSGSYRLALQDGLLTIRGSASRLTSSQQTSAEQAQFDLAGTIFNPAKYKARMGMAWEQGGLSIASFVNYTSGVTSRLFAGTSEKGASFTTVDATLRYDTAARRNSGGGWVFALSADNLLDRDPPFYSVTSVTNPPFDSTNYSAIGRYVSVSVARHW